MKKALTILITLFLLVSLSGCFLLSDVNILKGFSSKSQHFEDGFQDYTDYAEYMYPNKTKFENSPLYKKVTSKDIPKLKEYFENYLLAIVNREGYKDWFHFDYKSQVKENDYFILKSDEPKGPDFKFENYDIYYFDTKSLTLYYFHTNI